MKAIAANFSLGKEAWDRVRAKLWRRGEESHGISLDLVEIPEPALAGPQWVRVRTIMSAISDMDEGLVLFHDMSPFGAFLSFPFVPGSENVGIVTDMGKDVDGIDLGQRVVVNPMLSCSPRGIHPLCPSCARGEPSNCLNFAKGDVGPGTMIGACQDTGGGWSDAFIAHKSQIRPIPDDMDTDHALLVPELTRAIKAVLRYPPAPGDRVIVLGAGSLGLSTLLAIKMLGHDPRILVVAELAFEAELAKQFFGAEVVLKHGPGTPYEDVADFVQGVVRYPKLGRVTLEGGADVVYETTGLTENVEDAMRFTGEGKRLALVGIRQATELDAAPLWCKGIKVSAVGFSGRQFHDGEMKETFDIAMSLVQGVPMPLEEFITHRFKMEEWRQAFNLLANRATGKAVKAIFQHVV